MGTEYISDDPVEADKTLVLTYLSAEDKTSALTKVRLGKFTGGYFHPWSETLAPVANQLCAAREDEKYLRMGEYFQAQFVGGAANDECWAYLDGYWMKDEG